jgi:hypothetical protein
VEAFATFTDLEARLNRTFSAEERVWVSTLLEDASSYLRDDVLGGQQVFPQASSTFTAYPSAGWVELPQHPVIEVTAVTRGGVSVPFSRRDESVYVDSTEPTEVTFTYGFATAPDTFVRWACVLVSQALIPLELKLGLAVGGLSSVALDDFKVSFASGAEGSGMELTQRNIDSLRARYGAQSFVTGVQ